MSVFGRPFVKRFALWYRTVVLSCPVCPVCDVDVLWTNGWMDQGETLHGGSWPRPWPHCVRWGRSSPSPKGHNPQSSVHFYCRQMVAHLSYCWAVAEASYWWNFYYVDFCGLCLCMFADTISLLCHMIVAMSVFADKFMIRISVRIIWAYSGLPSCSAVPTIFVKNVNNVLGCRCLYAIQSWRCCRVLETLLLISGFVLLSVTLSNGQIASVAYFLKFTVPVTVAFKAYLSITT